MWVCGHGAAPGFCGDLRVFFTGFWCVVVAVVLQVHAGGKPNSEQEPNGRYCAVLRCVNVSCHCISL